MTGGTEAALGTLTANGWFGMGVLLFSTQHGDVIPGGCVGAVRTSPPSAVRRADDSRPAP